MLTLFMTVITDPVSLSLSNTQMYALTNTDVHTHVFIHIRMYVRTSKPIWRFFALTKVLIRISLERSKLCFLASIDVSLASICKVRVEEEKKGGK